VERSPLSSKGSLQIIKKYVFGFFQTRGRGVMPREDLDLIRNFYVFEAKIRCYTYSPE